MKRIAIIVLTVFITAAFLLTAGPAAAEWKKITIGTEGAYPPFNLVDKNGELQGFDIDISKALCKAMGVEYDFVVQDWDGLIPGLLAKKYDCIIASMSMTPERRQRVDFTNKYYQSPAKFVARKGSGIEVTNAGLKGKTVGVQRATTHENFVRDKFGDAVTVKAYATLDEADMDLVSGRVDLVLGDSVALIDALLNKPEGKDFAFVGPGFTDVKYFGDGIGIAIRKGNPELVKMFNDAIDKIRADGTYQKINAKYFDFDLYGD